MSVSVNLPMSESVHAHLPVSGFVNLPVPLPKPFRNTITLATRHEDTPEGVYEIALDECGRGPMFGRLYAAAVVLPQDSEAYTSFPASSPKGTGLRPSPLWSNRHLKCKIATGYVYGQLC